MLYLCAGFLHGFEIHTNGKSSAFEHRTVHIPPSVTERKPGKDTAGFGVEDRRALTAHIREEDEAVSANL